jgi:hypothetical protein
MIVASSTAMGKNSPANLSIISNSTQAIDNGGTLGFGGKYSGDNWAQWAMIKGAKENSTSGQFGGYLAFGARPSAGNVTEAMRITSTGTIGIGTTSPPTTLSVQGPAQFVIASGVATSTCTTAIEGSQVYNLGNHHLWLCMGAEPWTLVK